MKVTTRASIEGARTLLARFGFDAARSNERSALTLLALLRLKPRQRWGSATSPLLRVAEIMDFLRDEYGKIYAPNTRETIRRQTLHQFVDAGLVQLNPDEARPTNSPNNRYRIAPRALTVIKHAGSARFERALSAYLLDLPGLLTKYAKERELGKIPVTLPDGRAVTLSPRGQSELLRSMVEEFCPRWTPGGKVLYIGDTGRKADDAVFETAELAALGVELDEHGKLPDLVVYMEDRDWLVLLEAASTHGPVDAKRYDELAKLFASASPGLVYVSCFPTRAVMRNYLADIAWETEVWCADAPTHLIHFDGERFLGPYDGGHAPRGGRKTKS